MTTGSTSDAPAHAPAFSRKSFAAPTALPEIDASKIASKINVFKPFWPLFPKVLALTTGRHARTPDDVVGLFIGWLERASSPGVACRMDRRALPRTMMGYVVRSSGRHQIGLAVLSAAVFGLSSVPLELQRRVVNDAINNGATETIFWLAIAYAGVALLEQALKMVLNVYRSWVSEDAVRTLRKTLEDIETTEHCEGDTTGTHTAMAVAEAEPIGGFVGMAISEPLLQAGILLSVMGYMAWLEPWTLLLSVGYLLPQALFVPPLQQAINRRAEDRIKTLRRVSGDIVETGTPDDVRVERVFELNMGIYKLKYGMNLGMNLMYAFAVAAALGVGGWFAVTGRIDVGTVVAVVSGLGKLKDPWSDLVSWGRELSVDSVKYRLFVDAVGRRGLATA